MDIRGVEITNQLRSAIRAKLLELGVKYDEELPDYILVMVVNKKSRQQMNEDLNLFLEDSTEPFVNWLHDQVLKKLQKVTIAKKKSNKDTIPNAIVKKEEDQERKKPKEEIDDSKPKKSSELTKHDRDREFDELVGDLAMLNEEDSKEGLQELENVENKTRKRKSSEHTPNSESNVDDFEKRNIISSSITVPKPSSSEKVTSSTISHSEVSEIKSDSSKQNLKRTSNSFDENVEEKQAKYSKISDDSDDEDGGRIKSFVNKPRSVVSVKSRLGVISPSKKDELKSKSSSDIHDTSNKSHLDSKRNDSSQKSSSNQSKIVDKRKQRNEDLRSEQRNKIQSSIISKGDKLKRIENLRDKERLSNKSGTIKSRLGIISNTHKEEKLSIKSSNSTTKVSKPRVSNVKSRLGVRTKQNKGLSALSRLSQLPQQSFDEEEDDDTESVINTSLKSHIIAVNPPVTKKLQSRNLSELKKNTDKKDKEKEIEEVTIDDDDDDEVKEDLCKVPSKVIVTPRPLKPLKPSQKRATQSLLLRAVAEANQSVVMQKKVDPCLKDQKKPVNNVKITRDPLKGKVVSVTLKSKKRLIMDKIKVELANSKKKKSSKTRSSNVVTDEHLDVVKSLFKRSDDKQKFLVTLNGYNNNVLKEQVLENDEPLEVEINEDDEVINKIEDEYTPYESYNENDQILEDYQDDQDVIIEDVYDHQDDVYINQENAYVNQENAYINQENAYVNQENAYVNQENAYVNQDNIYVANVNQDNVYVGQDNVYVNQKVEERENNTETSKLQENSSNNKKRKLSPIVYTRSRSKSPVNKPSLASTVTTVLRIDKRPLVSSVIRTVADKSSEKCRYWPNCTLGIKCAYYHPEVLCSSFPACKFGDKCAYKHPKCKFASSCTKPGCIFSHPPVKCKYHPYCMKPGCPFSHPRRSPISAINAPLTPDISSVRAKFTWKKKE